MAEILPGKDCARSISLIQRPNVSWQTSPAWTFGPARDKRPDADRAGTPQPRWFQGGTTKHRVESALIHTCHRSPGAFKTNYLVSFGHWPPQSKRDDLSRKGSGGSSWRSACQLRLDPVHPGDVSHPCSSRVSAPVPCYEQLPILEAGGVKIIPSYPLDGWRYAMLVDGPQSDEGFRASRPEQAGRPGSSYRPVVVCYGIS